jgi:hypothetical protein
LQAISSSNGNRSPPRARPASVADGRCWRGPEFSPCTGRPSSQSVASLPVSIISSTRLPSHPAGTTAVPRNQ